MGKRAPGLFSIGEVAERTGVSQRTLRFYEEIGLVTPPARLQGGYRLYSEAEVRRIERIQRLKSLLGLSLADIKGLLAVEELTQAPGHADPAGDTSEEQWEQLHNVVASLEEQRAIIERRIAELVMLRAQVDERLAAYRARLTPSRTIRGGT
jgi:MerR family transcriptional regulator, repressor of the yfmOP operon